MDNNNILFTKNAITGLVTAVGGTSGNTIITTPNKMAQLGDANIIAPATGQSLIYNSTNSKWENKNLNLSTLNDCNFTTPLSGDFIKWDYPTSKFINRPLQYASVNITGKINNTSLSTLNPALMTSSNYTSITTYDTFVNGLTVNQTLGQIQGLLINRTYLITAKLTLSPTGTTGGQLNLQVGTQTGATYSSGSSSTYYFNNSNSQLSASVSYIINLTSAVDGIMVKVLYSGGTYVGITPNDCNVVVSVKEL